MAVMEGATEIDVVISIGKFLEGNFAKKYSKNTELKAACRNAHLKVIIESGALQSVTKYQKASLLAMAAGADFIKRRQEKCPLQQLPEATYVMCQAIKEW